MILLLTTKFVCLNVLSYTAVHVCRFGCMCCPAHVHVSRVALFPLRCSVTHICAFFLFWMGVFGLPRWWLSPRDSSSIATFVIMICTCVYVALGPGLYDHSVSRSRCGL
eukprot:jgi/Botrbrau1/12134/Bobra.0186s0050.1